MLLAHFPKDYQPSDSQSHLIRDVDRAFSSGYKYVIVSAPTGSGKSFLAATLANCSNKPSQDFVKLINTYKAFKQDYTGNYINEVECLKEPPFGAFALTITKSLQDQYKGLFNEVPFLKGKTNYQCSVDELYDVETAPCVFLPKMKDSCWSKNICPYYSARNIALTSKFTVLNYKMFLHLPNHIKRKNYIICDEASELEEELVRQFTVNIDYKRLLNYGVLVKPLLSESHKIAYEWMIDVSFKLAEKIDSLIRKSQKDTNPVLGDRKSLLYLRNLYKNILDAESLWRKIEWVITKSGDSATFTPLKANKLASCIFDYADQVLLMSATIIDHKNFASSLGITKYQYIEAESTFDPKKSPIYVTTKHKLNYNNISRLIPTIAKQIKDICNMHKTNKGIIHTHSNEITRILKKYLTEERFLFRDETATNEHILDKHYKSLEPTVLVSPSLTHGIDLKDDLARFCIVVKLPYLPISDKRIKKLFDRDKNWYTNTMLNILVQMCGRTTRSKKDYSSTYILDGNSKQVLLNNKHKLPKFFIDRVY